MSNISKLICDLAKLSRGLDQENPEYSRQSRYKLALQLRSIISQVIALEASESDLSLRLFTAGDCALSLAEALKYDDVVFAQDCLNSILDACFGDDDE